MLDRSRDSWNKLREKTVTKDLYNDHEDRWHSRRYKAINLTDRQFIL